MEEQAAAKPTTAAKPSSEPYINHDLLAELLAEEVAVKSNSAKSEVKPESTYTISGDAELFLEFAVEAEDHLGSVESTVLNAEGNYDKDAVDNIDPDFIVDFIEKHLSLMEDFEACVLEYKYKISETEADISKLSPDFRSFIKGYIHTVKGDSGSIGMNSVQLVCHIS